MNENIKYKIIWFGIVSSIFTFYLALKLSIKIASPLDISAFDPISYGLFALSVGALLISRITHIIIKNRPFHSYMLRLVFIENFCILGFVLAFLNKNITIYYYYLSIGSGFLFLEYPKKV